MNRVQNYVEHFRCLRDENPRYVVVQEFVKSIRRRNDDFVITDLEENGI